MGEAYRSLLEQKIMQLGRTHLRVYINPAGVDPHYLLHLEEMFRTARATFVLSREDANFVFEGTCEPHSLPGQVTAFFTDSRLEFLGELAIHT